MPSEARLHPASILFGLISQVREFAVPLVLALVAGSQRGGFDTVAWIVFIPYTLVAVGRYFFFTYRFDPHELVIRSGLIFRNERHIPYGRIQNLDAVENVLHRALGVLDVRIDTGSGSDTDATLSVVTRGAYEDMRRHVFAGRETAVEAPVGGRAEAPASPPARLLLRLPAHELVLYGLIENRGGIVVAGLAGLLWEAGLTERFVERYAGPGAGDGGVIRGLVTGTTTVAPVWERLAIAAFVIFAILAVVRLLSVALALVRLHGFRVAKVGEDLRAEYGLLTRVTATIPLRRIQTLTITEGALHRLAGRSSVRVDTAGGAGPDGRRGRESLAPVISRDAWPALVREVLPELDLAAVDWRRPAPGAFARDVRRRLLLAATVSALAVWFWHWQAAALFVMLAAWAVLSARGHVNNMGWAAVDGAVIYKSGWLRRHVTIARHTRIQSVGLWQSPFDRRWSMATVGVDTAGASAASHRVRIPYLTRDDAGRLHAELSAAAARTAFRW